MNGDEDFPPVVISTRDLIHGHRLAGDLVLFAGDTCALCKHAETVLVIDRATLREAA